MTTRRGRRLLAAGAAVLALAGCTTQVTGRGTPPPKPPSPSELAQQGVDNLGGAPNGYAMTLRVSVASTTVEIAARAKDDTGTAEVTVDGQKARLVYVDGQGYVNAPASFWTEYDGLSAADAAEVAGRWTESGGRADQLFLYTDQAKFSSELQELTDDDYELTGRSEFSGVPVFELKSDDTTLQVATADPHRLVTVTAGNDLGSLSFSYPTDDVEADEPADALPYPA